MNLLRGHSDGPKGPRAPQRELRLVVALLLATSWVFLPRAEASDEGESREAARQQVIKATFAQHVPELQACVFRSGTIELQWVIHDGAAREVTMVSDTTGHRSQGPCVIRAVQSMTFDLDDGPASFLTHYEVPTPVCLSHGGSEAWPEARVGSFRVVGAHGDGAMLATLAEGYRREADRIAWVLGLTLPSGPIEVTVYASNEQKLQETGNGGNGHVCGGSSIHTIDRAVDTHELTHVVLSQFGRPPPLLSEGVPVWVHMKDHLYGRWASDGWRSLGLTPDALKTAGGFVTVARTQGHSSEAYNLSGALVNELVGAIGVSGLMELYGEAALLGEGADLDALLAKRSLTLDALHRRVLDGVQRRERE